MDFGDLGSALNGLPGGRGVVAGGADSEVPIFSIERVQLQFQISSMAAMAVSNNVLYMALSTGRILRIDLSNPQDIDDVSLPKKPAEIGIIRHIFLDPTGTHLLITTTLSENFYLSSRSARPKPLTRLKGHAITAVAWNPSEPTTSTKSILIGTADGSVIETYIEPSEEYFKREERYFRPAWKAPGGGAIDGLHVDVLPGKPDLRRVIVTAGGRLWHWVSKIVRHAPGDVSPTFVKFFDAEAAAVHKDFQPAARSLLAISPDDGDPEFLDDLSYAWLNESGVYYGKLYTAPTTVELGNVIFKDSRLFPESRLPQGQNPIQSVALTKYHILVLKDNEIFAINMLDGKLVFHDRLPYTEKFVGLMADRKSSTFWTYSSENIYEITVTREDRDIWRIYLAQKRFDEALRMAKYPQEKDAVAIANGEFLLENSSFIEAANVFGKSTKPFESVAISFLELQRADALRQYLVVKLAGLKPAAKMQRTILASWVVELFMEKLNSLEDAVSAKLSEQSNEDEIVQANKAKPNGLFSKKSAKADVSNEAEIERIKKAFQEFVVQHKAVLDRRTTYDIISSNGREDELLFYANSIDDHSFMLSYWVRLEKWKEALYVLRKQESPEVYYKYSTVMLVNCPRDAVDSWMRVPELVPRKLIPAILSYSATVTGGLDQNQAIPYLLYVINKLKSEDTAVHNTLIAIYASHPTRDESALLEYLELHDQERFYDTDFALRLCIKHERVQSCIFIYSSMKLYEEAVNLALEHDNVELASIVADRPLDDAALRKKLWLRVAKRVIYKEKGIKSALDFLKRCELLKIEDLLPFFPDFVVIDDFKDEICTALEEYSRNIELLRKEMDESTLTSENIRNDIASLDRRFAIVEPGERCFICSFPLLARQFFVFPCQHAFHQDCLVTRTAEIAEPKLKAEIKALQAEVAKGQSAEKLDALVSSECLLCGDHMISTLDNGLFEEEDPAVERSWAL
ncbi:Pep3/Vps18/deep orange family-domain-containing protein [Dipodascopsis tothii]|uniref:Pep3/Vps18/deep orange family-domain-containing protein n=1 Tax=Dipodascopsis tothii TaxID=44089 RepID=UPI0034CEA084